MRPLSARSVVLSLLLGAHPPEIPVSVLVDAGGLFGISSSTLRVALTRMVAQGDLERTEATYRLSSRLLTRQRRQDAALDPATRTWDGSWEMVVVTSAGRSASDRAELRATLTDLRLAELREGVWMRPANLVRDLPAWPPELLTQFRATPTEDPAGLAADLWNLADWNRDAKQLLEQVIDTVVAADRLAIAAAMVRHLRTDPVLPQPLLPPDWVGADLRAAYAAYQRELIETGMPVQISP